MAGIHALVQAFVNPPREERDPAVLRMVSAVAAAMANNAELRAENARLRESIASLVRPYEKGRTT